MRIAAVHAIWSLSGGKRTERGKRQIFAQVFTDQVFTDQVFTDQVFTDQVFTDQVPAQ